MVSMSCDATVEPVARSAVRRARHPDAGHSCDERRQRGIAPQHDVGLVARRVEREELA